MKIKQKKGNDNPNKLVQEERKDRTNEKLT